MKSKNGKNAAENKRQYNDKYYRSNIKQMAFVLNKNTDRDIIEFLGSLTNRNAYIKELIRQDLKNRK